MVDDDDDDILVEVIWQKRHCLEEYASSIVRRLGHIDCPHHDGNKYRPTVKKDHQSLDEEAWGEQQVVVVPRREH